MNYTVSLLTLKADCQALINIASAEKDDLLYRRSGLLRQSQVASSTSMEIESGLVAVNAELSALNGIIANLPPGPTYEENVVRRKKAEYKKFLLEQRRVNYGPIAMVEREYDIARIDQAITESDAFIAVLNTRMDELPL